MPKINSRTKGQTGEREIIKLLQPIIDRVYDDHRLPAPQLQRNTLQAHKGGFDVVGIDSLAIEIKREERLNLSDWWQQTIKQANGRTPVLIYRQNRQKWRVRMVGSIDFVPMVVDVSMDDFLRWFAGHIGELATFERLKDIEIPNIAIEIPNIAIELHNSNIELRQSLIDVTL